MPFFLFRTIKGDFFLILQHTLVYIMAVYADQHHAFFKRCREVLSTHAVYFKWVYDGVWSRRNWSLTYCLASILTFVFVYNLKNLRLIKMWLEIQSMCFLLTYLLCSAVNSFWRSWQLEFLSRDIRQSEESTQILFWGISRHFVMLYFYWFRCFTNCVLLLLWVLIVSWTHMTSCQGQDICWVIC